MRGWRRCDEEEKAAPSPCVSLFLPLQQLRSVEEAEAVKHDLVTLQIENARLRDASEAVAQERQQFEVRLPGLCLWHLFLMRSSFLSRVFMLSL